jgi:23S rRNA (uracil1939-C5)-methyltransferase
LAAPRPASPPSALNLVTVGSIGADGDGVAVAPDGAPLFLAGTLPGELVQPGPLSKRGQAWAADATVLKPSPDRVIPPCPHFGPCGGCSVQHWSDPAYATWKAGLMADVLRKLGFTGTLPPLIRTPAAARRRMDFAIRREKSGALTIGLHARRSTTIVDMTACPVLHPALFNLVQALRKVLRSLDGLKREASAVVNLLDSGPDLLLRTDAVLSTRDRQRLTELAQTQVLPRIAWAQGARDQPEPACLLRAATATFSGRITPIPPGAFLQASLEGEAAIRDATIAALPAMPAKGRIVELFAGVGTLSHALSERGRVQAFEGDAPAIAALRAAGNPRVSATQRDLARQPLQAAELKGAAAIVLDPPFTGALAQMPALAASGLPIIYVTCNPAALLRDARLLTTAGYRITSAIAIDQFLWSARVEGVVAFTKPKTLHS